MPDGSFDASPVTAAAITTPLPVDFDSSEKISPDPQPSPADSTTDTEAASSTPTKDAKSDSTELPSSSKKKSDVFVQPVSLGVYEMLIEVQSWTENIPGWKTFDAAKTFCDDWPFVKRFIIECVMLAPFQFLLWVVAKLVACFVPAISLYLSGNLMNVIQEFIEDGAKDANIERFYWAAGSLFAFRIFLNRTDVYQEKLESQLKKTISTHFTDYLLRVNLRLDLPTWNDPVVKAQLKQIGPEYSVDPAWRIVSGGVRLVSGIIGITSEVYVLMAMISDDQSGRTFATLAAIHPILDVLSWRSIIPKAFYVYIKDTEFARLPKMKQMATDDSYRQHIIGDGLQDYIHKDFKAGNEALAKKNTLPFWDQFYGRANVVMSLFSSVSQDLPLVLFALQAIRSNKRLPLKSLTLLSSSASSIGWRVDDMIQELKKFADFNRTIRALYESIDISNQVQDDGAPYPPPEASDEGMKIEFRDVSFTYPQKDAPVLKSLSFTIQPGQLCVIVGENGCGKSSSVKLINRLFDATKGTVFVDDAPVRSYKADELRSAQAILYQDFVRYPTNIRDNIGFGRISKVDDSAEIRKAAELGGALEFIEKLPNSFDSQIQPTSATWSSMGKAAVDGPLRAQVKALEEQVNVSGGQWQRLAVSRSFMRAADEKVRLMCYDEPSSALDPKAEFELFEKLRLHRGNRTLIFITHRFGHLTKYADLILYMKDGAILEHGTHAELLAQDGNYAHLYNVQAQAFS